ncbi:MAG TPA: DUF4468 domain-containing protein [Mucilaginibacter sp.]|jgi:hypothetical protein
MKRIIVATICILLAKVTCAQQELLSFDEHNKYIYYQVIETPGLPADTLQKRGLCFLKTAYPKFKLKSGNEKNINGEGEFATYSGASILKKESGEIIYELNVEVEDQKYRYWLTNFTFTPYVKDRYGNFVPQMGVNIPLEKAQAKFDKKDVDNYLNQTGTFCKQFGDRLKQFILNPPKKEEVAKKEEVTKKVVTDKW